MNNNSNLFFAILLSFLVLLGWQQVKNRYFPAPEVSVTQELPNSPLVQSIAPEVPIISREEELTQSPRVQIASQKLRGSISLKGAKFDDLQLLDYKQSLESDSKNVELLSPAQSTNSYFVELGWTSGDSNPIILPNADTLWHASAQQLTPAQDLTLSWVNPQGIRFELVYSLDDNYLISVKQIVSNPLGQPISLHSYGLINHRIQHDKQANNAVLHQGAIGVINEALEELSYDKLKEVHHKYFANQQCAWVGFTDKYWLVSFIPQDKLSSNINFRHHHDKFQVDILTVAQQVPAKQQLITNYKLFVGPKKVDLLNAYQKQYSIKLFDRAIDFGRLYILTKPIFYTLNFLYQICGNFGVSIIILTCLVKVLMFGLTRKSSLTMKRLKELQPSIESIRQKYSNDKMQVNQKVLELYKREKLNPASGCLPILLQIPVFFAIYKVLYVTIEMRQAPFFGWIKDLSVPDPTSIFNLFGLLSFQVPQALQIGVWPILMSLTMYLQQTNTAPADPVQAQVLKFLPLIFLVMFSSFPVGLLIYWTCSNLISYAQQYYINHKFAA